MLSEAPLVALEEAKVDKEAHGEFESEYPGYCGAQDIFCVGTFKGVGRIYQQSFLDTYTKLATALLGFFNPLLPELPRSADQPFSSYRDFPLALAPRR